MNRRDYTPKVWKSSTERQLRGESSERLACEFLQAKGLVLLDQNVRYKMGEIDLVMKDKETLVFVEVRYRTKHAFGGAAASVTYSKQRKIIKAALHYQQKNAPKSYMRFDVIAFEGNNEMQWFKAAFNGF